MKRIYIFVFLTTLLTACAGAESPRMIASHPDGELIAVYPSHPEPYSNQTITYDANLELEVSNTDKATEEAKDIAIKYGGYLLSSHTWFQNGDKHITAVIHIPAVHFESARGDLLRLGEVLSEHVSGDASGWNSFSTFTIHFHPKSFDLPSISLPNWRPARTFQKAWQVFATIFGFLVDVVIWVAVVAGPFVLIGWLVWKFILRKRKS